jgi:SP family arabinose:H+ symporter-like MFS transporter
LETPRQSCKKSSYQSTKQKQLKQPSYSHQDTSFPIFLAIATGAFNQLTGINAILYYLNDIFALAGYSKVSSGFQAVIIGATNLLFTLIAMAVIDKLGRKQLLLIGSVGMSICLAGVAVIMQMHKNMESLVWFLVAYIGFFAFSQGAVIWVYISEIFPTQVRAKGQSLGCSTHWIMNALISGTFPMLAAQSGSMPFYFFALMMVAQFLVVLFIFPETKGITLEQMEKRLGMAQNEHAHTPST